MIRRFLFAAALLLLPLSAVAQAPGPASAPCDRVVTQYGAMLAQQTVTIERLNEELRASSAKVAELERKAAPAAAPKPKPDDGKK